MLLYNGSKVTGFVTVNDLLSGHRFIASGAKEDAFGDYIYPISALKSSLPDTKHSSSKFEKFENFNTKLERVVAFPKGKLSDNINPKTILDLSKKVAKISENTTKVYSLFAELSEQYI